jgi:polyphosphate glucokinase
LFVDGHLVPNLELGHLQLPQLGEAELYASARIRTQLNLDWPAWSERANLVFAELHRLFWPDVFILSGGLIEHYAAFEKLLHSRAEIRPAAFRAHAGIVGAALAAAGNS